MTHELIAKQLVTEWHAKGKMPSFAWDFQGFAAEVARRAITIEREACSQFQEERSIARHGYDKHGDGAAIRRRA